MARKEKKPEEKPEEAPKVAGKLTPVDVRRASFGSSMFGGFKKGEVQAFLERVAKSMEEILRDKRTLEEQLGELRTHLGSTDSLKAERDKLDEQLFLLTGEVDTYKRELEELRARVEVTGATVGSSPEMDALKQENEVLRSENEAMRVQLETMSVGSFETGDADVMRAEIESLRAQLAEARAGSEGPAETIALARRVADQIKQKAKEEAIQSIKQLIEKMENIAQGL